MTSCPPIDLIQASRAGTLPAHLQERIQAHVAQCAICAALGEALEDESISNPTREERERIELRLRAGISRDTQEALQRRRWRWTAAAAVLAIATVGALMVWRGRIFRDAIRSSTSDGLMPRELSRLAATRAAVSIAIWPASASL